MNYWRPLPHTHTHTHTNTHTHTLTQHRLNYIEQHAERLGMDADRLDSARTSAARASPLGETLELCAVSSMQLFP
jgi:coenzyme F420-reducing hydrogenase delta subunit